MLRISSLHLLISRHLCASTRLLHRRLGALAEKVCDTRLHTRMECGSDQGALVENLTNTQTHIQSDSREQRSPVENLSKTHTHVPGDGREQSSPPESLLCTHMQDGSAPLESFVIVYNVSKRHNIGTLVRSATAFGVSEIILVGRHKDFNAFGSHGAAAHLRYRHFFTLADARSHLKEKGCDIIGVEITDEAMPVHSHPFTRSTAFLLGNEGSGLSDKEMAICDSFIYIPQYGSGTASLNVTVAASIVLHHFAVWAGFFERPREGHKFVVAEPPSKQMQRVVCKETPEMVAEMRRLKKGSFGDWFKDIEQHDGESLHSDEGQGLVSVPSETSSILTKLFED